MSYDYHSEAKNKTRYRMLNVVNNDPRVNTVFQDEDGLWLWLNPGWTCDPYSAHDAHEDNVKALLSRYKRMVTCMCGSCVNRYRRQPHA